MSKPTEQSKNAASSNMYVRKPVRRQAKKPYKKIAYKGVKQTRHARGMVRAQNMRRHYVKVEDCTSMYLLSLLDPTAEESRGACIPSGFPMPSQKARVYQRGTLTCGTTGDGFIIMQPVIVNDYQALVFSGTASVGTAGTPFASFTNTASAAFSKLPFTTAQVATNATVAGRVVSACLRVRYAGTEASRAGLFTSCEHPDHGNLALNSSNDISLFENSYRERPSGDGSWFQVNWSGPVAPSEVEYVNSINVSGSAGTAPLVIAMNGLANGASIEYEAWMNVEYIGKDTIGKTINHIDEQGYGNTLQVVKGVAGTRSLNPDAAPSVLEKFGNAVIDNMPQIIGTIGKGIDAFSPGSMIGQAYKSIWGNNPSQRRLTY